MKQKVILNTNIRILIGLFIGIFTGYCNQPLLNQTAGYVSEIFMNLLKLISAPIIFLSIMSTISGMKNLGEFNLIGRRLIKYTLLTSWIAALIALGLYILINPVYSEIGSSVSEVHNFENGYIKYLMQSIPSNIMIPFSDNNVMAILFMAILFSSAILFLPEEQRKTLNTLFSSLNSMILKVASWIIYIIPIAIWAFITIFITEIKGSTELKEIALYLTVVIGSNLVQGLAVLPILTKSKGLNPLKLAKSMLPALSLAFFSKSSGATLPMTMQCAEERAGISRKISKIGFPLCTVINMNGCAAFILTTVLFVSMNQGIKYSAFELIIWTLIATAAAVGNAGVPMGCYFLSTAFLATMNIPLTIMAIILPFYALIDMIETCLNVWSDACVVGIVDKELEHNLEINAEH